MIHSIIAVKEGLSTVVENLCSGFILRLGHVVKIIQCHENGVQVHCNIGSKTEVFSADACLCTIPLGVLKHSVKPDKEKRVEGPKFIPNLPSWKIDAINSLAVGNLNKVILVFEKAFWEQKLLFGHIGDSMSPATRGELFMFHSLCGKPAVTVLISGDAADASEEQPKTFFISKAMNLLAAVFNSACPKEPVEAFVTRWRSDPFSNGAFSYMATDSEVDAYDLLAKPIADFTGINRIFFAGEHTSRKQPATVHGAYMSGLREAARIADQFLGCPYAY